MAKIHQWFVVRGRAAIWRENSSVLLELDPEGAAYCIFSVQDAQEIAGIIADEARVIWEVSDKSIDQAAQVDGDVYSSCKLHVESGSLQIMIHDVEPLIAVTYDLNSTCRMDVTQAIALVQIIQYMVESINSRAR